MITILIGVIILAYVIKNFGKIDEFFVGGGVALGMIIIVCGILVPMAGFTEPVEETTELMPLRLEQENDKQYYLECKGEYYYYAYDNSEQYSLDGGAYEETSIYRHSKVKVYESEQCTTPVLKVFKIKSKISWYSLAGMWDEKEYVFYIPFGTLYVAE